MADPKWKNANVALRADGFLGIDVDHYDDKDGLTDLFNLEQDLGELPATVSSTSRGADSPSRQYFFRVPEGFESVSRLSRNIEVVQHNHRYSVVAPSIHATGAQYQWFDANGQEMWGMPSPADFAELPERWINHMRADQQATHDGFSGSVNEWLDTLADGEPSETVKNVVERLPTTNFTHDDVIKIIWNLVRLGAEGHAGIRWALGEIYGTWVKPPYDTEEYTRELELAITTAVSKGGAPEWPEPLPKPSLLPMVERYDGLEDWVWGNKPVSDSERSSLIRHLHSLGLNKHEIYSFVWHSNQAVYAHESEAWAEVTEYEPGLNGSATAETATVNLLTEAERDLVQETPNLICQYQQIAKIREENPNLPYHRANALSFMSILYGDVGHLPKRGSFGGVGLNLYQIIAGDTTSGKGESKNQLLSSLRYALGDDLDGIDIGGDPSPEALHKKMIERDGEVTWFNLDEGDQLLARLTEKNGYSTGLQQKLTDWFEGRVGARLRMSDTESAKNAKAYLVLWLMGTPTAIMANLQPKQVESGFLARFVTYFGNPRRISEASLETDEQDDEEIALGYDPYVRQFAVEQAFVKRVRFFTADGSTVPIRQSKAAKARLTKARIDMFKPYQGHRLADLLEPTLIRTGMNMWKVAGLVAMSRGSSTIEVEDVLVAVEQAEEWLPNLVRLMEGVVSSEWTQEVEKVFEWVKQHGSVSKAATYRKFNSKMDFEVDNLTRSLVNQKRIRDNGREGTWEVLE